MFNRKGRLQRARAAALSFGLGVAGSSFGIAADPPPISFASPLDIPTGDEPVDLLAADFNGDGRKDLAVAVFDAVGGAAIFLGRGDGTFDPAAPALAPQWLADIVSADFNRDGHLDLAALQAGTQSIAFAFGNGDGTFASGPVYATGMQTYYILPGDFNGDGWPDLLLGGPYSGLAVFPNLRTGLMGPRIDVQPNGPEPFFGGESAYAVADLDSDGKDDIVVAAYDQWGFECSGLGFTFWRSLGAGSFSSSHRTGPMCPYAISAVDWTRDGRLDVLVLGFDGLGVYQNLGGGAFAPASPPYAAIDAYRLVDADFNLDGVLDLALPVNTNFLPRAARADGTLAPGTPVPFAGRYTAIARDDFDNDGLPDLAAAVFAFDAGQVNAVQVFLNRSVTPPSPIGQAAASAAPLLVTGYDAATGDVSITYGPACGATDHSVVYGNLEPPDRGLYLGRSCGLGTTGSGLFNPGAGSVFFLLVGDNATVEGSYGTASSGAERPESFGLGACDRPQVLTTACP